MTRSGGNLFLLLKVVAMDGGGHRIDMVPDTNPVTSFFKAATARYEAGLLTGLWKGKRKDIKTDIVQQ